MMNHFRMVIADLSADASRLWSFFESETGV